jgi:uncharacterized protein YlxP (DUF503 family)
MLITSVRFSLRLYASSSLKEKRFVLSSVKQRLRNRFNLSISEVGGQESWREAELGIALVTQEKAQADSTLEAVTRFLDGDGRFEIVHRLVEYF